MTPYIPCLNPDNPDNGGGFSVGIGAGPTGEGGGSVAPGISFTHSDSPVTLTIIPVPPFIIFGPNFQFWSNLFGLGETRIDREKQAIQDVLTSIFKFLHSAYGVPIRDGHALQFDSSGVQQQFARRPDIAALVPALLPSAPTVTKDVFAHGTPTEGQIERTVNQYLANAAINDWPAQATLDIWNGMLDAANPACSSVPDRWLKNPEIVRSAAIGAVLLQYIPLDVLLNMSTRHAIGDPLLEHIIQQWASNPGLVGAVPSITGLPWQSIYLEGAWARPPYGDNFGNIVPLLSRDHIQPIINTIAIPQIRYPDFGGQQQTPIPPPQPQPQPQPQTPPPPPPIPQPTPTPPPIQPLPPPVDAIPIPQPGGQTGSGPPPDAIPGVTFTQAQIDMACMVSRLLLGNASLTDEELAFYHNPQYAHLIAQQMQNPACQAPVYRQPPPTPPSTQHQYTPQDADFACYIVRLLSGNSVLTPQEDAWLHDPQNATIINWMLQNPQCQIPLYRSQPGQNPQPVPPLCQPTPGPPSQGPPPPNPQPLPQPIPDPSQQPCPPDCLREIHLLQQQQQECCDEVHQNVIPRLTDLEWWIVDIERRLPGPMPPLPQPYPIPPVGSLPPTELPPAGEPPPEPEPEPEPQPQPPITKDTPGLCTAIIDCVTENCLRLNQELEKCKKTPTPSDCGEGIEKWGKWAECWLKAKTLGPQGLTPYWGASLTVSYCVEQFKATLSDAPPQAIAAVLSQQVSAMPALLGGDLSGVGRTYTPYDPGPGYVFENTNPPNVLEIP